MDKTKMQKGLKGKKKEESVNKAQVEERAEEALLKAYLSDKEQAIAHLEVELGNLRSEALRYKLALKLGPASSRR